MLGAADLAAQDPGWEATMLFSRTKSSVKFDANSAANGDRMGFAPGVAIARPTKFGAIRMEAALVEKGFERTQPTYHWTYLEFPILAELRPDRTKTLQAVAQAGLAPSVALKCSIKYDHVNGSYSGNCRDRDPLGLLSPVTTIDVSWVVGLGLRVGPPRNPLLLEFRGTKSMIPVEKQTKHLVLSAGVGFAFSFADGAK